MVAETASRGSRLFPEINIQFRKAGRSAQIVLPPAVQAATLSAIVAVAVSLSCLAIGRIGNDRLIAEKEEAVVRAETANIDLQDQAAKLQEKLAVAARDRVRAEARLSGLTGEADKLRSLLSPAAAEDAGTPEAGRTGEPTHTLEQTQRELRQAEAQRATLAARLSKVEADRAEQQTRLNQYKASLEAVAKKLQQLSADRDKAVNERDRLRARSGEHEQKHSQRAIPWLLQSATIARLVGFISPELARAEADQTRPDVLITDAPPESDADTGRVAELGHRAIIQLEGVLASTGLDIGRLFPQLGLNRAQGGPFVLPPKGDQRGEITSEKLEAMRSLIKSLPLATPLDYYQLESRFGPRHDPFNRRMSFHTGLDLSAPYMSPVYATAPGIVTYAGYRADYGKVVEIDHGNGIATIYGHMHRFIVSVGQQVEEHTQIGFLGSSGRSSGPHVHYEIRVNDEPQDPEKFIGLARLIPVAQ